MSFLAPVARSHPAFLLSFLSSSCSLVELCKTVQAAWRRAGRFRWGSEWLRVGVMQKEKCWACSWRAEQGAYWVARGSARMGRMRPDVEDGCIRVARAGRTTCRRGRCHLGLLLARQRTRGFPGVCGKVPGAGKEIEGFGQELESCGALLPGTGLGQAGGSWLERGER